MDKDKRDDLNRNGIDDEIEPPLVDVTAGTRQLADRLQNNQGSTATPGRNDLDAIGKAIGVTYADGEELKVGEKEEGRDKHRWELDPASSEDYVDRTKDPE